MPTLNWIGKEAVIRHHKDVPFRLLEPVPGLACGAGDGGACLRPLVLIQVEPRRVGIETLDVERVN